MLRITRINQGQLVTLKLEGSLLQAWADELTQALSLARRESDCAGLDLSNVTFVDHTGAQLLRDAVGHGVRIVACSNFVAELLQVRKP